MSDIITKIGNSVIQYGNYNDRIYLMKLSSSDFPVIIDIIDKLAQANAYSKIFAKIPAYAKDGFFENGFEIEASIPNFYTNDNEAFFMAKFLTEARKQNTKSEEINMVLKAAHQRTVESKMIKLGLGFTYRRCGISDAPQIAKIYKKIFATYPFPIYDPDYIVKTMQQNVIFFAIIYKGTIIALSSAEIDAEAGNAEMTDFAILPEYSRKGFSIFLLQLMESEVKKQQIKTVYSIARALSFGMNITLAKMGYHYCGTSINNTNISGSFESMNIWYKYLFSNTCSS
jgi:putative beta-lysine N-acetyltransferase